MITHDFLKITFHFNCLVCPINSIYITIPVVEDKQVYPINITTLMSPIVEDKQLGANCDIVSLLRKIFFLVRIASYLQFLSYLS